MCLNVYYVHDVVISVKNNYVMTLAPKKCYLLQRFCSIETWTLSEKVVEAQVVEVEFTAQIAKETKIVRMNWLRIIYKKSLGPGLIIR